MLKNLSLRAKIVLGSSVTLVLMVIIGFISIGSTKSLVTTMGWVDHTHIVIGEANSILAAAVDMETGYRGYLLAGKEEFLDPYKQGRESFLSLVADLSNTVSDNPAQVQLLSEIKDTITQWQAKVTEPEIALRREIGDAKTMNDMAKLIAQAKGKTYFDKFRGQIATFIGREQKLMDQRKQKAQEVLTSGNTDMQLLAETIKWVSHTYDVIADANEILAAAVDMETGMRGYLLAGKEDFLDPYTEGQKQFNTKVAALSGVVSDNPAQVQLLAEIKANIDDWLENVTQENIALRRKIGDAKTMDDMARLVGEAHGKVYFDKFRGQIKTFTDREAALMQERKNAANDTSQNAKRLIIGGIIAAAVLAVVVALILAGSVIRPFKQIFKGLKTLSTGELDTVRAQFKEVTEGLTNGAEQVASASSGIAAGSSQQAASLEETSSSLEEMSSMTQSNADNAVQADTLMKESSAIIDQANTSMTDLTQSMAEIAKASEDTSKIVKTIDEIAFQTNLLALNAAVEAARAGEAGAGFAVVADEVRNLAMRAAEAAKNTANLIEDTVKKVKSGSQIVTQTNDNFSEVASSAGKVAELISEIAAASKEQAEGIGQVNKAVVEMDRVVQANAASTEELSSQSEELNTLVGVLLQITEGRQANSHRASRTAMEVPKKRKGLPGIQHQPQPKDVIPLEDDFKNF